MQSKYNWSVKKEEEKGEKNVRLQNPSCLHPKTAGRERVCVHVYIRGGGSVFTVRSRESLAGRQPCKAPGFHCRKHSRAPRHEENTRRCACTHRRAHKKTNIQHESFLNKTRERRAHRETHTHGRLEDFYLRELCLTWAFICVYPHPLTELYP